MQDNKFAERRFRRYESNSEWPSGKNTLYKVIDNEKAEREKVVKKPRVKEKQLLTK